MVLITIIGLSIGYSVLNTDLSISGEAEFVVTYGIAKNKILNDNGGQEYIEGKGTPIFDGVATTDEGMYATEDNDGISYYYRGAVNNNWLYFAGFYWRIIRVNGDGSVRLIYNGTTTNQTGSDTQIGTSAFNEQSDDNAYVGYMYGTPGSSTYEETHANINDSTIKTVLDNWYQTNLASYSDYISHGAGFCNDRGLNTTDEVWNATDTKLGYGMNMTAYGAYGRLILNSNFRVNQKPNLKCSQTNDYFTTSESHKGNRLLIYPIGLVTADEVLFAGGFGGMGNNGYYLYTNQYYWTMSSFHFNEVSSYVFNISTSGNFGGARVYAIRGVRPVINLDSNIILLGDGTKDNPYKIVS